jgi:hypothetical protein
MNTQPYWCHSTVKPGDDGNTAFVIVPTEMEGVDFRIHNYTLEMSPVFTVSIQKFLEVVY